MIQYISVSSFISAALAIATAMFLYLSDYSPGTEFITVYAALDNAAGVEDRTPVTINGYRIGRVTGVELVGGRAKITMQVEKDVLVPADSTIAIRDRGLIGMNVSLEIRGGTASAGIAEAAYLATVR